MIKPKHLILALVAGLWTSAALAGPFEDGAEAFKRGDYARALTAWGPIADSNPEVQNSLGVMYMDGKGVTRNFATAHQWFERSAANRSSSGQNNLGGLYRDGRGVPRDYRKSMTFFAASAAQGNAGGQLNLGLMYMHGEGIRPDYQRAYMWVTLSAAQGMPKAAINRDILQKQMSPQDIDIAMKMAARCKQSNYHVCN